MIKKTLFMLWLALTAFTGANAQTKQQQNDSLKTVELNRQVDLGVEYLSGDSLAKDYDKALSLIRDATEKGNRYGQLWLGLCYSDGIGVEKNEKEAFRWFLSSAEKGNVAAMNYVGKAYEFGEGVAPDIQQAVKYYRQSAEQGYSVAQINMAVLYEHGNGVGRDMKKSFEMMKMAAAEKEGAKYLLAKYYFNGWGTDKNPAEALSLMNSLKGGRFDEEATHYAQIIERGDTMKSYEFQFRWIPNLLWDYEKGKIEESILTDIMEWQLHLGSMFISHYEWDWSQISAKVYHEADSIDVIVYRMPEPEEPPMCRFAAAVIDRKHHNACKYFTLEKTISFAKDNSTSDAWMFCGVGNAGGNMHHLNYGPFKENATEENFLKRVLKDNTPNVVTTQKKK